jgi:hypothetical protein
VFGLFCQRISPGRTHCTIYQLSKAKNNSAQKRRAGMIIKVVYAYVSYRRFRTKNNIDKNSMVIIRAENPFIHKKTKFKEEFYHKCYEKSRYLKQLEIY